jgi:hypothetical protein
VRPAAIKQVAVKKVPVDQLGNFPRFLAGPQQAVDPADEPSDRRWTFWLEGRWKNGSFKFYVWQVPGRASQEEDVLQYLIEKASGLGICCLWIYDVQRPTPTEIVEYIRTLNREKPWAN